MTNRSEFKSILYALEDKFPVLMSAKNIKLKNGFGNSMGEVGMSKKYIQKADRIESFVTTDLYQAKEKGNEFIYNSEMEHIYVKASNEMSALELANSIENIINNHDTEIDIMKVNINPIYDAPEEVTVKEGHYTKIEIEQVFPNGSPRKRADATAANQLELLSAAKANTTFSAAKGDGLDVENFVADPEIQSNLKKGYMKITRNKVNIIANKIKTLVIGESVNANE